MAKASTKNAKTQTAGREVAFVASTALSLDVGHEAMEAFAKTKATDAQIAALSEANTVQKYQTLKSLTQAFTKAAIGDKSIKLGDIHSDVDKDVSKLRLKLEVATGIKVAQRNEDGTDKFVLAPWTKEFLPQPGEDKESDAWRKKETFRTNFAAVFKKSILAADAIVSKGLKVEEDKKTGVLMISGKAIKEHFNVDQVALNEKREIKEGDKTVKLAKTPSYTELGRISAAAHGQVVSTRVDSRAKLGGAKVSEGDVLGAVKSLIAAVDKLKNFGDELATGLENLQEAIDKALNRNGSSEAA